MKKQVRKYKDDGYQKWRSTLPKGLQYEGDYDLKGYYDKYHKANIAPNGHLTDEFKLPNHPTFSNESQYFMQSPWSAGYWQGIPQGPQQIGDEWVPFNPAVKQPIQEYKDGGNVPAFHTSDVGVYNKRKAAYDDSTYLHNNLQPYFNGEMAKFRDKRTMPHDPYAAKLNPTGAKTKPINILEEDAQKYWRQRSKFKESLLSNVDKNLKGARIEEYIGDGFNGPQRDYAPNSFHAYQDDRVIGHSDYPYKTSDGWGNAVFDLTGPYIKEPFPAPVQDVILDVPPGKKIQDNKRLPVQNTQRMAIPVPQQMRQYDVPTMPVIKDKGWYSNSQNVHIDAPDEEIEQRLYDEQGNRKYKYGGNINTNDMKKGTKKPCMNCGGQYMEMGGNPQGMYWNGKKYVPHAGSGTYSGSTYFQQGGPSYPKVKQEPGYWTPYSLWEDGGNITELREGGYIPGPINAQPQVLKQTNGTYHMATGGYIPAPIGYHPQILKETDGQRHMQMGGYPSAPSGDQYNGVYTARPGAPLKKDGGYWHTYSLWEDGGHIAELQNGGPVQDVGDYNDTEMKKGGNWIKGAVNPAHKGYCTPMTKSTCTPRRKAFAMTMKKHHGFHKEHGGYYDANMPLYALGGPSPDGPSEDEAAGADSLYTNKPTAADPTAADTGVVNYPPQEEAAWRAGMTDEQAQANINAGGTMNPDGSYGPPQQRRPTGMQKAAAYGQGFNNLLGAGLMTASHFANNKSQRNMAAYNRQQGMSSNMPMVQDPGSKGDYNSNGVFRPNQMVPTNTGYYAPGGMGGGPQGMYAPRTQQYGGMQYKNGGEYHLSDSEIARLKKMGYQIEEL